MNTSHYHFVFKKVAPDNYVPVLGKVNYENGELVSWEPIVFQEHFKPLHDSYNNICREVDIMAMAKSNLPVMINEDDTLSFFHPNKEISFNQRNETVLNYSHTEENSSLMNIDLDDDIMAQMEKLGADMKTVEGVQKFYEMLGGALLEFIKNADDIDDEEKERLAKSIKISK